MVPIYYSYLDTPVGRLWVAATERGLYRVTLGPSEGEFLTSLRRFGGEPERDEEPFRELFNRLRDYFRGVPTSFSDLALDLRGTEFQRAVWRAVAEIPYGRVSTYKEIAARVGRPRAYRAVGNAVGRNRLMIVVPCHRVVRADGRIGGFGGGVEVKRYLLRLEGLDRF